MTMQSGIFFTEHDVDVRSRVAVIGTTVATNLFGSVNPVGKKIRVGNAPYTVIGLIEDDFNVRNLTSLMETMNETTTMITLLLGSIAGISLIVGGIGIMNIMMVSVTERTREIGIRKAIGATYNSIMMQFLIESTMISILGGIIGIFLGIGLAQAISKFGNFTTVISSESIIASFGFSLFVGVFFGMLPARKAAKLDPIDALRYE